MNSNSERIIHPLLSKDNVTAQIAQLLYATGYINDNEEVVSLEFNNVGKEIPSNMIPLTIKLKEVN